MAGHVVQLTAKGDGVRAVRAPYARPWMLMTRTLLLVAPVPRGRPVGAQLEPAIGVRCGAVARADPPVRICTSCGNVGPCGGPSGVYR